MTSRNRAALSLEARKLARAPVARVATAASLLLVLVTTAGGYAAALHSGGTDMGRQAAAMITAPGWDGYAGLAATSVGITNLLAVGIVMSWSIGREFTDGTIVGLFALPVPRTAIADAKMCAAVCWLALLASAESILITISGLALGLPWHGAARTVLTIALVAALLSLSALPVMWIATAGRGYLAGIAATLAIVVVTNVAAGFGLGQVLPWAIPVLWANPDSALDPLLLLAPLAVALAGAFLTRRTWARLELGDS
ncbi:ABC transporter [Brachybacterium sp. P6-10-X1]|uniref:ABC transporter permease n=1 Tax=Brachybacterium sp. P6-10-X1 TaxID=1903186 RepID=UPI000971A53B|nr:ABC transporter permease [Brachybacterium sp. P6-10-X1]APX33220.1 ABC transporter [Brachybacterium sp. P6-10-X1]